jgi:hypothetical protein
LTWTAFGIPSWQLKKHGTFVTNERYLRVESGGELQAAEDHLCRTANLLARASIFALALAGQYARLRLV